MRTSKGISPVIAELLIVTIAIVLAVSVIGFVMGWFKWSSGGTQSIYLYPDSRIYLDKNNNSVYSIIKIKSNYKPMIVIENVYIDKYRSSNFTIISIIQGEAYVERGKGLILHDGTICIIRIDFKNLPPEEVKPDVPGKVEISLVSDTGLIIRGALTIVEKP